MENFKIIANDYNHFIDPSYDKVFKAIFGEGNIYVGKNGNDQLLNLSNSLILPQQKDKYFIKVTSVINVKDKIIKG